MWKKKLIWIDGRAFANHDFWECIGRGLHKDTGHFGDEQKAFNVLFHLEEFALAALNQCPISAAVHLTNHSINHKSYIGQLACCLVSDCSISTTTKAWWSMSRHEQEKANKKAIEASEQWIKMNLKNEIYQSQSGQLGFPF